MSAGRFSKVFRRVGLPVALAVIGTVSLGAGVYAATIKSSQTQTTAAGFDTHQCDGPLAHLPAGQDGWHFVVPAAAGDGFQSITLTFSASGTPVTVGPITSKDEDHPNTGSGWSGWLDKAGSAYKHAYVITSAGWVLTGATAVLAGEKPNATFNLSHTCPAAVESTPTPGQSSPAESPSPEPSESESTPAESPSPQPSESTPAESPSPEPSDSTPAESPSPEPSESESTPAESPSPEPSHSTPAESPSPQPSESESTPAESPSPEPSESESTPAESPSPQPSESESTPAESPSAQPSDSTSPSTPAVPIDQLPTTGSPLGTILMGAGGLLLAGSILLLVSNRRRLVDLDEQLA